MSHYYNANDTRNPRYDNLATPSSRSTGTPLDTSQESLYTYDSRVTPGRYSDNPTAPYASRDGLGYSLDSVAEPFPARYSPEDTPTQEPYPTEDLNRNYPRYSQSSPRGSFITRGEPRDSSAVSQAKYPQRDSPRDSPAFPRDYHSSSTRDLHESRDSPRNSSLVPRAQHSYREIFRDPPYIPRDHNNSPTREPRASRDSPRSSSSVPRAQYNYTETPRDSPYLPRDPYVNPASPRNDQDLSRSNEPSGRDSLRKALQNPLNPDRDEMSSEREPLPRKYPLNAPTEVSISRQPPNGIYPGGSMGPDPRHAPASVDLGLAKGSSQDMKGSYRNPVFENTPNSKSESLAVIPPEGASSGGIQDKPIETFKVTRKEKSRRCCGYRALVVILILLAVFGIIMMSLFIWRATCCKESQESPDSSRTINPPPSPTGCPRPYPVFFATLPKSISDEMQRLQTFIHDQTNKHKQATAVSANVVYRDQVIWSGGFGVMNKSAPTPTSPTPNTIYPCASVSKILTALMLFKLYNENKIESLHQPITRYEPRFKVNNPFNGHKITLHDLASQLSGLPREAPCYPENKTDICPHSYNTMLKRIANETLVREPESTAQYSNLAYGILGQVLFSSFGVDSFGQWVEAQIFTPLAMMSSTYTPTISEKQNIPVGYTSDTKYSQVQEWGWLAPAGGMFSSVTDLAKLQVELMSDKENNKLLSKSLNQEFFLPVYFFRDGKKMVGTPWEIEYHQGYLIRKKAGYIYGYNSLVAMVPELRLGFNSICTDCNGKLDTSLHVYFKKIVTLFNNALINATLKSYVKPSDPSPYLGRYNNSIPTISRMDVKAQSDKLVLAVNGFELFYLNYTMPLTFKIHVNPTLDCNTVYTLGVTGDVVVFDRSLSSGLSPGFTMFSAHPSGKSYFKRA